MKYWLSILSCALLISGCTTPKGGNAQAGNNRGNNPAASYMIMRDFTSFYSLGPAQPSGPDLSLRNGDRVTLIKKEWGFSRVQISDGREGYVDNASLAPAPPEPKPSSDTATAGRKGKKGSQPYYGEQVNDTPLPEMPPPNLNIAPEDAPDAVATPSGTPINPSFRY